MNRLTLFSDIAGRVALDTRGNPRVTAAAIAVATDTVSEIQSKLPSALPKWGKCNLSDAERVIDLLTSHAVSVGIFSINKDTAAWHQFAEDSKTLQRAFVAKLSPPAGWAKPTNLLTFCLLGGACAIAMGHGLRNARPGIVDNNGLQMIECSVVCDSDISGEENLEVFQSFWQKRRAPTSRLAELGFELSYKTVRVATEQEEPLLLLADYAAGIAHASLLPSPGRLPLPLSHGQANELIAHLKQTGRVAIKNTEFNISFDEIFGQVMELARGHAAF